MPHPDVITIQIKRLGGKKVLDIRRCITIAGGAYIPTSRGVTLDIGRMKELVEKISRANGKIEVLEL